MPQNRERFHDRVVKAIQRLTPANTIFEEFPEAGYETGVFAENSWLTDVDAGLKDAFDTVEEPRDVSFPDKRPDEFRGGTRPGAVQGIPQGMLSLRY